MTANEARRRVEEGKARIDREMKSNAEGYANSTISAEVVKATSKLERCCKVKEMNTEKENKYLKEYLEKRGFTVVFLGMTNEIKIEW